MDMAEISFMRTSWIWQLNWAVILTAQHSDSTESLAEETNWWISKRKICLISCWNLHFTKPSLPSVVILWWNKMFAALISTFQNIIPKRYQKCTNYSIFLYCSIHSLNQFWTVLNKLKRGNRLNDGKWRTEWERGSWYITQTVWWNVDVLAVDNRGECLSGLSRSNDG